MAPEKWPPLFGCCLNSSTIANTELGVSGNKQDVEKDPVTDMEDLLMPERMMDTWFCRIRRQFKDVERNAEGTPNSRRTLKEFLAVSQQLETILRKEKEAVLRSYRRSQECVHQKNELIKPPVQ